jgi:hypothetical protein
MTINIDKSQENNEDVKRKLSICDVITDNTNEVIMKIESLIPTNIGNFVDLSSEYLRIARDFFGTCYIAEKEFLDKVGVDHQVVEEFDKFLKVITKTSVAEIEMASNFQKIFVNNIMSAMRSYDDYVKLMLSAYAKVFEYNPVLTPKKN